MFKPSYMYQIALDIYHEVHPDFEEFSDDERETLYSMYALLAITKGNNVTCEDVHNAWAANTAVYRSSHRCLVPFDQLTKEEQDLDILYQCAIIDVSERLGLL